MNGERPALIATGTTTKTQYMLRAYLPDGRIQDSQPMARISEPGSSHRIVSEFFGRLALPKGTRFERLERTVTVTASEWRPAVDPDTPQETPSSTEGTNP